MAFKLVTNTATDIRKTKGHPYIGTYTGHTDITTKIGPQVIWSFLGEDGLPFGIYGFTNLNRAMSAIKEGALCRIIYQGTQFVKTKFKPTGQDVHQVTVEIDSDGEQEDAGEAAEAY